MPVLRATAAAVERQYEVIGNATASVSSLISSASPEAGTAPKPAVVPNEAYPTLDAEPADSMGTMTLATRRPVPTIAVTLGGPVYPTSIVVTTDAEPSTRPWITSTQEISDVVVVGTGAGSGPVESGDATDAGGGGQAEGSTQPAGPPQTLGGSSTDPRGQTRVPDGDSPSAPTGAAPTGTTSFGNAIHVSDGTESVFTTMSFSFSLFTKNGHLTSSVMPVTVVGTTTIPLPPDEGWGGVGWRCGATRARAGVYCAPAEAAATAGVLKAGGGELGGGAGDEKCRVLAGSKHLRLSKKCIYFPLMAVTLSRLTLNLKVVAAWFLPTDVGYGKATKRRQFSGSVVHVRSIAISVSIANHRESRAIESARC
ncbi:hypothetical protein C8R43DRAFT_965475 [Mycena crocata]|nr:hypothetical protein C8R43DRAFT_965475 [Mycena crocata]